jgi:CxxC motif-containing protein (DUF1111 family)
MKNTFKHIRRILIATGILVPVFIFTEACNKPEPLEETDMNEWYSGGRQTVFVTGSGAYSQMFRSLTGLKEELHEIGDIAFEAIFNSDVTQRNYGLGPVFNNVSCVSCHVGDGRGKAPGTGEALS